MNRLLQGDVGSGKTIVAIAAMLLAVEAGYQAALMAPTQILAEQHYDVLRRWLEPLGVHVALRTAARQEQSGPLPLFDRSAQDSDNARASLRSAPASGAGAVVSTARASKAQRNREKSSSSRDAMTYMRQASFRQSGTIIARDEPQIVVGTHALLYESVSFSDLGLAVVDEQHKFGVAQRARLTAREPAPDVLVMTATPIPRTLTMTIYGDLDVSIIDELPPGRTPIETRVFGEELRAEVKELIAREVRAGRQVYVVYPLVEESEKMDLKDATQRYEYLRDKVFPKLSVGLVHGKMKSADKEEAMRRFIAGETQILVSTTVIEVGVDVPNASVMIVEHAERFGLSQLHQLRGRVGRGAEKSYCVLLTSDKQTAVAVERLGIMAKSNDGFVIAEKDLELRGPGELLGTRQSGLPEFRIANLVRDQKFLEGARKEAEFYLAKGEKSPETAKLIERVKADPRFGLAAVG
jgi:ATP-dependent DNA helicase RecG